MPRPFCKRFVDWRPDAVLFKPVGTPARDLELVELSLCEVEALRLADLGGEYQEAAARKMKISRATFARIVESARRKTADALVNGKCIQIQLDTDILHPLPAPGPGKHAGCHGRGRGGGGRHRGPPTPPIQGNSP